MITLTADYFRSVIATTPEDLLPSVYLILNEVAPTFKGVELGIGDGIIIKSLQDATGKSSYWVHLFPHPQRQHQNRHEEVR